MPDPTRHPISDGPSGALAAALTEHGVRLTALHRELTELVDAAAATGDWSFHALSELDAATDLLDAAARRLTGALSPPSSQRGDNDPGSHPSPSAGRHPNDPTRPGAGAPTHCARETPVSE